MGGAKRAQGCTESPKERQAADHLKQRKQQAK